MSLKAACLICVAFTLISVNAFNLKGKVLSGDVDFQQISDAPETLEEKSCLKLTLEDVTSLFAKPIKVAEATMENIGKEYDKERALKYRLDLPDDKKLSEENNYAISAVLNIGWCKGKSEERYDDEWIRDKDFLTDTTFVVKNLKQCAESSNDECHGPKISLVKNKSHE